jgi:hypothetical protein
LRIAQKNTSGNRFGRDSIEKGYMKRKNKRWIKPVLKQVPIFFECTAYAGAI